MGKTRKKDFIELKFLAKIKESGIIFDTNMEEEAKKANLPGKSKPLRICIGQNMVIKGLDKELEDKEIGKKYAVDIKPEEGFGVRNSKLIRMIPIKIFLEKKISPIKGLMLNMDNMLARIVSVSSGRVMVDFNNPLSGKVIQYEFTIEKIISEDIEKIDSLAEFFCGEKSGAKVEGKKAEIKLKSMRNADFLKKKAKEILDIDLDIKENKKEESDKEQSQDLSGIDAEEH